MSIATFGLNTTNTVQQWEDVYLSQALPTSVSPGGNTRLYISNPSGNQKKVVFRAPGIKAYFDTVGPVTINSATVKWRRVNNVTAPSRNVELRKLLVAFNETQSTWNNRVTGTPWGTAGAIGAGDVDATVLATGLMPSTGSQYFSITGAGLTAFVAGLVDGSITSDLGYTISLENPTTTGSGDFDLNSSNDTDGNRPYLEIDYTALVPPNITVDDIAVNNLSGTATFTVSLSSSFASPVTVYRKTTDDTAISPGDFTALPLELVTFAPGETTKTVEVTLVP